MFARNSITVSLLTLTFLLTFPANAEQPLDSIAPSDIAGVVSGAPNLVLDRTTTSNFDVCVSRIGISPSKDLQTVNQEVEECRAQAREQSAPISAEALDDFKQQLREQRSPVVE
jgi:hypothetical protein